MTAACWPQGEAEAGAPGLGAVRALLRSLGVGWTAGLPASQHDAATSAPGLSARASQSPSAPIGSTVPRRRGRPRSSMTAPPGGEPPGCPLHPAEHPVVPRWDGDRPRRAPPSSCSRSTTATTESPRQDLDRSNPHGVMRLIRLFHEWRDADRRPCAQGHICACTRPPAASTDAQCQ